MNTILVAGATGIAGDATIRHFAALPGWQVLALSRRRPAELPGVRHLAVDLLDAKQCRDVLGELRSVTHVAYMALVEEDDLLSGWRSPSQMGANLAMLTNLLDGLEPSMASLRHFSMLQGGKAYGSHLRAVPVPAKERWPRGDHEIFYWPQEDLLRERQKNGNWGFAVLRPMRILGAAIGSPMNIISAIGAYAAIMRHLGEPMRFPGGARYVTACTDSRMLGQAIEFVGTDPAAANETFNVVNGDVMVWHDLWPSLAAHFGMTTGDPQEAVLAERMPELAAVWDDVVKTHDLVPNTLDQLVGRSWQFADYAFATVGQNPPRVLMSPIKLRQAGFAPCYDTEDSILYWLKRMQDDRVLPR